MTTTTWPSRAEWHRRGVHVYEEGDRLDGRAGCSVLAPGLMLCDGCGVLRREGADWTFRRIDGIGRDFCPMHVGGPYVVKRTRE